MNQDRKCSLCGFVIHGDDPLKDSRKKQHIEYHKAGRAEGINRVKGIPEWITIW